jgi:hypothetical protein
VLIGEFVAGDSFSLRAGQSVSVSKNAQLNFQLIKDLTVTIKDPSGATTNMNGYEDANSARLYTNPYVLDKKVISGATYNISTSHPTLGAASAVINIPGPINAKVIDTVSSVYSTDTVMQIRIKLRDPANAVNYYVIEAVKQTVQIKGEFYYANTWHSIGYEPDLYLQVKAAGNIQMRFDTLYNQEYIRQAMYTTDPYSENVVDNGKFTRSKRVLIKDAQFNGSDYETTVYVVRDNAEAGNDEKKGLVTLYIKSVSADYFTFLKSYETYTPATGLGSSEQPVIIKGNIQNGLGMIGGVSQVKYTYINDTWSF